MAAEDREGASRDGFFRPKVGSHVHGQNRGSRRSDSSRLPGEVVPIRNSKSNYANGLFLGGLLR